MSDAKIQGCPCPFSTVSHNPLCIAPHSLSSMRCCELSVCFVQLCLIISLKCGSLQVKIYQSTNIYILIFSALFLLSKIYFFKVSNNTAYNESKGRNTLNVKIHIVSKV